MNWRNYMSFVDYWPVVAAVIGIYFIFFLVVNIRISMRKRRAVDEERFIKDQYYDTKIPEILLRYYGKDVECYNRAIARWPYKWIWKKLENKFVNE